MLDMAGKLAELCRALKIGLPSRLLAPTAPASGGARPYAACPFRRNPPKIGCRSSMTHDPAHCKDVALAVDALQIGLCAAKRFADCRGRTGKPINVKGPIPGALGHGQRGRQDRIHRQHESHGCERGSASATTPWSPTCAPCRFWPRPLPGHFDATHSVQQPGGQGTSSGRLALPLLARAAAVGVAGIFLETHDNPDKAPSDGPNMIKFKELRSILDVVLEFDRIAKKKPVSL